MMQQSTIADTGRCLPPQKMKAVRFVLTGRVQGIGVRPAVYRLATSLHLNGWVRNDSTGLHIHVEGNNDLVSEFSRDLNCNLPKQTQIDSIQEHPTELVDGRPFRIDESSNKAQTTAPAPQDVATCQQCISEVTDPSNRRFAYPFTSCTVCGPRYSILTGMPYDRHLTTMSSFQMCDACRDEYEDPVSHRFHAQTNACPDCGPQIWCSDRPASIMARHSQAIEMATKAILNGQIVAVRGLGGYQFFTDATNDEAVQRLRRRKNRPKKPFAVMVDHVSRIRAIAECDQRERDVLTSEVNPVVVLRSRNDSTIARSVNSGLSSLGVMLPTTPLHLLLMRGIDRPAVCTSANMDSNPIQYDIDSSHDELSGICDLWLHHDRPIEFPIDDSVVRVIAGKPVTLRLGRGLAPLQLKNSEYSAPSSDCCHHISAVGGHMKVATAWSCGNILTLGPHIGDMDTLESRERYDKLTSQWQKLYQHKPNAYVRDHHPDYFTTRWVSQQSDKIHEAQHHHAHIVAAMVEHGWLDREILGVAWDGTGYGDDQTIWGGEFLLVTRRDYKRFARLRPFCLPSSEGAIAQPWRIAVAVLEQVASSYPELCNVYYERISANLGRSTLDNVREMTRHRNIAPITSSAGRLFDAAAALILDTTSSEGEGYPAMMLESIANIECTSEYPMDLGAGTLVELDWRPLVVGILKDLEQGTCRAEMAMKFHRALATGIVTIVRLRADLPVVLGGGVFQNKLLTELVYNKLGNGRREIALPGIVPPNDGGLALGQLAIGMSQQWDK